MYLFVFREKLSQLNPLLYVDTDKATQVNEEWRVAAIRLRKGRASAERTSVVGLQADAARFLSDSESGNIDEVVGGVPLEWVPEYDLLDPKAERPRLLAKGWRSIVQALVKRGLCSVERARQVFSRSLGETDYDRSSLEQRWARTFPETFKKVNGL